jgi:hypothetical protein
LGLAAFVGLAIFMADGTDVNAGPPGTLGRLSPASLDFDTCGCPSWFGDPTCEERTYWSIEKTTASGPFEDPENEPYSFTVTVTEGETAQTLTGEATLIITNSGDQTTYLSSIVVGLEKVAQKFVAPGNALGPSGKNWHVLAYAIENEAAECGDTAKTAYGDATATPGANVVVYDATGNDIIALSSQYPLPPTIDNDGDGLRDEDPVYTGLNDTANSCAIIDNDGDGLYDEDPIDFDGEGNPIDNDGDGLFNEDDPDDDGDGLVDEDGACEDAVIFIVRYEFDISGLGIEGPGDGIIPSTDDLRINLMGTFVAGGKRGGAPDVDTNCNGVIDIADPNCDPSQGFCYDERWVNTVQQRLVFDPIPCTPVCGEVTLTDEGITVQSEEGCVVVTGGDGFTETIYATGNPGTVSEYYVEGTVDCDYYCTEYPDYTGFQGFLDEQEGDDGIVNMKVAYPYNGGPAYFQTTVLNAGPLLDGVYNGWCVDLDTTIANNTVYCAELISSYDLETVADIVDKPGNLDIVNWILNQDYVYKESPGGYGTYTYGDVQKAIWHFIDDGQSNNGIGPYDWNRINEIIAAAGDAGVGFVPGCGEVVAVLLRPVGRLVNGECTPADAQVTIAQVTVIDVPGICIPCPPCNATITNTATLECADGAEGLVDGSPASASFDVTCNPQEPPPFFTGDFCSQTQGGWGQTCSKPDPCGGGNVGCFRDCVFDDLFPGSLFIGDTVLDGATNGYAIELTDSAAVEEFLRENGGTPGQLTADLQDPEMATAGIFANQLVAAKLNVAVDAAGLRRDGGEQPFPAGTLGTLVYVGCVDEMLLGLSVNEVIALADYAISGVETFDQAYVSALSDALAALNQNFVDCDTNVGCLALP